MKKETLKTVIIASSAVIVAGGGVLIINSVIKNKPPKNNTGDNLSENVQHGQKTQGIEPIKVGDTIYTVSSGATIRDEARVDNTYPSTIITAGFKGLIGKVTAVVVGKTDSLTWYKVQLAEPIKGFTSWGYPKTYTEAYVRYDVVTKTAQ